MATEPMKWAVICLTCGKKIDEGVNGAWMEAVARNHAIVTGDHEVYVGYRIETK